MGASPFGGSHQEFESAGCQEQDCTESGEAVHAQDYQILRSAGPCSTAFGHDEGCVGECGEEEGCAAQLHESEHVRVTQWYVGLVKSNGNV
jgi:hypothetical protein